MAASAPTPKAQATADKRRRWSEFVNAQMRQRGWTPGEFCRRIDRPSINPSMITHWTKANAGASPEIAVRVAQILDLPASHVLREAGHGELADYIDDVAGNTADDAAALEPLIARVRAITQGLDDTQRTALEKELLDQIGDWYLLAEAKAARLRRATEDGDTTRGAS